MFEFIANSLTYDLLGLQEGVALADAVHFFIYDVLKILFLIFTVVSVIAFVRTFFKPGDLKKWMSRSRFGLGNVAAASFGAVTPFCSCSSIPLFIGFVKARIPLGIAFSFLITSPLVNEVAFVIMGGLFGWKLAFLYALSGIVLGVLGGLILGCFNLEKDLILEDRRAVDLTERKVPKAISKKAQIALSEGRKTFKKLWPYVVGGVAIGAVIHGYVPEEFFMNTIGKYEILAVPLAVLMGIPIYAGCSMLVPLVFTITSNGVPLGTSLAFMMSIAGLSLPEGIILKRVMKFRLLGVFFLMVGIGIVGIGYLFNFLQ